MDREQVKKWLLDNTESIEQTDIEKQSMLGEDVIDLMVDLVKNNDLLHDVSCFSAEQMEEAYRDGQYDSEEGKGNKFDINNYS